MTIGAALFDLDGTLADTLPLCYVAFRRAVVGAGGPQLSDAEIHALFGPSEEGMMRRVLPEDWPGALATFLGEYERLLPTCPPIVPELASALALLKRCGVAVGLVTGKGEASAMLSLRHFGIADAFDAVETGSPAGVVKAEAIARLLGRWGMAPDRAIYVGDAVADMVAAREAGVIPVGAAWAAGVRAADLSAAGAHVVFTAPGDFVAWLAPRLPGHDVPRA